MFILILQFYKIVEECLKVGTQVGCICWPLVCWKVTRGSTFVWLVSSRLEESSTFFLAVNHPIFCDAVFCSFKGQVTENGLLDSFISGTSSRSPPYIWSSTQFNRCKKKFTTMFDLKILTTSSVSSLRISIIILRGHKRQRKERLGSKSKCDLHSQLCAGRELCSISCTNSIHRVYILYMYIIYKLPLCAGQGAKCTIDNIHNTFYIYTVNAFHMLYCIYPSVCRAGSPLHRGLYRGCDILNSYTALVGVNT